MNLYKVYAPLSEFWWTGQDFTIAPGIEIKRLYQIPDLRGLENVLAADERGILRSAGHWLTFDWSTDEKPAPNEIVNLVLIALWLSQPTKAHVELCFEISNDPAMAPDGWHRYLDHFSWVPGAAVDKIENANLTEAALYYPKLRDLHLASGRLQNGLSLTSAGCMTHSWQPALICHSAAAEAILTYDTGQGITRRLALSYACLVENSAAERNRAFLEFRDLYSVRSDIMHGRSYNVVAGDRLPILARFEAILRKLWRVVLASPVLIQVIEGSDAQRAAHFRRLQGRYNPPP
jgi:hypothetical protein